MLSSPRALPLEGPLPPPAADLDMDNVIAGSAPPRDMVRGSVCTGLRVRCAAGVDGPATSFLQLPGPAAAAAGLGQDVASDGLYAWPWHAEIMLEGSPASTGALVTESWVLASAEALRNVK